MDKLSITDLHVTVEGKHILNGVNLKVPLGEVHALMGPNGSGKSTLAMTLMGHPRYRVTRGTAWYRGKNILGFSPDKRAKLGVFLGFQYPSEISGVSIGNFLRAALQTRQSKLLSVQHTYEQLMKQASRMKMPGDYITRGVNEGFSGGEKKRSEIFQLAVLQPSMVILDEPDSGLDVDALRRVAKDINVMRDKTRGMLVITHYERLLKLIKPDVVHVMVGGRIVKTGGPEVARELEKHGYKVTRA
jgi:Fe-S cluster assembly ATP-binding protein